MGYLDNLQSLIQKHKAVIGHRSGVFSLTNLMCKTHVICHYQGSRCKVTINVDKTIVNLSAVSVNF